jgi:two-component system, cell cycle response regulator DivK
MKKEGNSMGSDGAKKVLIIDDDHRNTFALNAVLKAKGFFCTTADSAEEGLKILSSDSEFAVILLDMMMPEMDGYEAILAIRHQQIKTIPIISVTAQAMQGDEEKCLEAGANAYIPKSVDADKLLSLLNRYI